MDDNDIPKQPLPLSITFSYPYGNGFDPNWLESVIHLLLYETSKPKEERVLGSILKHGSCYVADNREKLCIEFNNRTQDDWLLMVDPDVGFKHTILEDLKSLIELNPDAKIIAGRVDLLNGLPIFYMVDSEKGANIHQPFPFRGLKEFDLVGTGIICIAREVIKKVVETTGHQHIFSKVVLANGLGLGDDFSFCVRARQAGYKIYGAWDIYGQHYKGGIPVPRRYLEESDLMIKGF